MLALADAVDMVSVFVRPNRNDSYFIRIVRTCTIHGLEDPQSSFDCCQKSGTDKKNRNGR